MNNGQVKHYPLQPALHGAFAARFYGRLTKLSEAHESGEADLEKVVLEEIEWAVDEATINPMQRRIYRATWLLLRDLVRVGWTYRYENGTLQVAPPTISKHASTHEEVQAVKGIVRRAMTESRQGRIIEAREFVQRMENPPPSGRAQVPVTSVIARVSATPDKEPGIELALV